MSTRKIILLSCIAILLAVYCVQLVTAGKNTVTVLAVASEIDQLVIEKAGSDTVTLSKNGDMWIVRSGTNNPEPADDSAVMRAVSAIKEIRVLETVSRLGDDERYGFAADSITVTASSGGTIVRTIITGKRAETRLQSYVKLDGSDNVLLISGTPADAFVKKTEDWVKKAEPIATPDSVQPEPTETGIVDTL